MNNEEPSLEFSPRNRRILIVDDQIFNIEALISILVYKFNLDKNSIDHAMNGEEALKIIKKDLKNHSRARVSISNPVEFNPENVMSSYILILMDCNMPFMDGFESAKLIRR